jgi:hypothetical protein
MTEKRFADERESIAVIPVAVKPVVVETRLAAVRTEHRDVPTIVVVEGRRTTRPYQKPSRSPPIELAKKQTLSRLNFI